MFAEDRNAHAMGMIVSAVAPGSATVEMTVLESMANGLDVCHGGVVFALADTAMAFASNARGGTNLASNASIEWLAPARVGDRLVAEASETHTRAAPGCTASWCRAPRVSLRSFTARRSASRTKDRLRHE